MSLNRRIFMKMASMTGLGAVSYPMTSTAQTSSLLPAPMMPAPSFVNTNGIRMAVYEKGSGPAVVFSHGFPELAFSWRSQLDAVAAAGYHAIAPDQLGYGLTGGPEDPAPRMTPAPPLEDRTARGLRNN